jgi:hypothetical protein
MASYILVQVVDDLGNVILQPQGGTVQNMVDFDVVAPESGMRTYTLQAQVYLDGTGDGTPQMFRRDLTAIVLKK